MKAAKLFFILLCLAALIAPAAAAGGAGTAANPYVIETAAEFQSIQNNLAAHYIMANDIVLPSSFTTIGSLSEPFYGSLNGNGYKLTTSVTVFFGVSGSISNIVLSDCVLNTGTSSKSALFIQNIIGGATAEDMAVIDNVDVVNCVLNGPFQRDNIGLIGACYTGYSQIINCDVEYSEINNVNYDGCGFIVGRISYQGIYHKIDSCTVKNSAIYIQDSKSGTIHGILCGGARSGSVAGHKTIINNCIVENCIISGLRASGGAIFGAGYNKPDITISNCIVKNTVCNFGYYAAAICGYADHAATTITISNCDVIGSTIVAPPGKASAIYNSNGAILQSITDCFVSDCTILGATTGGISSAV